MISKTYHFTQKGTNLLVDVYKDFRCYVYRLTFYKHGFRNVSFEDVPFKDGDGDPITIEDIMNKFNLVAQERGN